MHKIAIVLLADTVTSEGMGRMANALMAAQEFVEAGDDVRFIFDGAAVKWVGELADPDHRYHKVFEKVRDKVTGVCLYCAKAFKVADKVSAANLPFADGYKDHPSFRDLIANGYQVLTF